MRSVCAFILLFFSVNTAFANERILVLAPHACEILYAIGAEKDIVGVVSYCDYPEATKALPRVGSYERINVEAAIVLKPTLAIVLNEHTPSVNKLRALGVKIVESNPVLVDEVLSNIRKLGQVTGHEKRAEVLSQSLQARLDKITAAASDKTTPVFYEIWSDPLLTAGKHTFIHDVLKHIGLRNVFGDVEAEAPRINVESVVAAAPRIVIIPSENRDVAVRSTYWKKWLGEDIQVITVNPDLVHRPGPRLLDGMEHLSKQLKDLNL